jgi:hypothetical protein
MIPSRRPSPAPGLALAACALAAPGLAQGPAFQTPGMPSYAAGQTGADMGQANRFSSGFNPAFSFLLDSVAGHAEVDGNGDEDGFDAELRVFELAGNAWVDPNAWAYFVGAAEEDALELEEAAVVYTGLPGHHTLRAGRVFVDFGKQMQIHVHELRTLERPLALRTYLGEEVKGEGVQWDNWITVGDETALRWSLGVFANLLPESVEDVDPLTQAVQEVASPKDLDEVNLTARVTGFTDVGSRGVFQLGASARVIPEYDFVYEPTGVTEDDLSNVVYGIDATYGWTDDTGEERWTLGAEVLANTGDNGSAIVDPDTIPGNGDETIQVFDDTGIGYLVWGDYAWDLYNSAGLQFSADELPDGDDSDESELEVYYTHMFSEFHRLRVVASRFDSDAGDDVVRIALQYTATLGAHGHGVNW